MHLKLKYLTLSRPQNEIKNIFNVQGTFKIQTNKKNIVYYLLCLLSLVHYAY